MNGFPVPPLLKNLSSFRGCALPLATPYRAAWTRPNPGSNSQDEAELKKLFTQFSFPGGIFSHVAPTTPGSIHEGGELGYSLSHAFDAAFDNLDLIVACIVGDGEAETGPFAKAWQSTKFLHAATDGATATAFGPGLMAEDLPDLLPGVFQRLQGHS